jgi:hypothetical protein
MRALTLLSLPALLCACLPSGDGGTPSTSRADASPSDADAAQPECEMDGHCPRLQVCEAGECVTRYCAHLDPGASCGQDPTYTAPRGCHMAWGMCTAPECDPFNAGRCLVLMADRKVGDADDACVQSVCQPPP